jgi:hypothetical protein
VEALAFQRGIEDPGAWLKWAIETDFELPDTLSLFDAQSDGSPSSRHVSDDHDQAAPGADPKHLPGTVETELLPPSIADSRAKAVWDPLLKEVSQQINTPSLLVWFEGTVPTAFENSTLVLWVPNHFALEYIETRFGELIRKVLKEQVGADADLLVQAPDSSSSINSTRSR